MNSENSSDDAMTFWLWWGLDRADIRGSLARAMLAFQAKHWANGRAPEVVKATPALASDGLGAAAAALGLAVIPDKRVLPGTIYLGLKGGGDSD